MLHRALKSSDAELERKRRYYQENKAALKAKAARYKRDNPDKVRKYSATYRERYQIELRLRSAIYYSRKRETVLRRMRERYATAKTIVYRPAVDTNHVDSHSWPCPDRNPARSSQVSTC